MAITSPVSPQTQHMAPQNSPANAPASGTPASSYQFAPSSIEGWNDCPVLPHSLSGDGKKTAPSRRNRRPVHVSHIGYHGDSSQSSLTESESSTSGPPRPGVSRLPPTTSTSSISLKDGVSCARKRAKDRLDTLVASASTLGEEQHRTCGAKLADGSMLDTDTNVVFLDRLFAAWDVGSHNIDDAAVVDLLYNFTQANGAKGDTIAWLSALKKIMAGLKE